jgi:hypothetical protein
MADPKHSETKGFCAVLRQFADEFASKFEGDDHGATDSLRCQSLFAAKNFSRIMGQVTATHLHVNPSTESP